MPNNYPSPDDYYDTTSLELDEMLYARHAEVESFNDLTVQRGTPIPTLFNNFYKYIQNPSSVSVDTFKRMVDTDETIGAGCDFLTTCLAARLGKYVHKSKEITAYVNDRLEEIEGGWTNKVKEILSAAWAGFFVGEKVWANTENGFVIERIPPLPPTTILFEVDRAGRLTEDGILQYQRNWGPFGQSYGLGFMGNSVASSGFFGGPTKPDVFAKVGDLPFPLRSANPFSYLSIRIPKQKCVHYSFNAQGNFDNPYGRSLLRRVYKYYVLKDAILRMYATALDRKGTPMTVIFADPNATVKDARVNANDSIPASRAGNIGISAMAAAREIFKNPHNDSVFILPGRKDQIYGIESITQDFNADAFLGGVNMCDRSMLRGLLIPALIFGGGDAGGGSWALGQEHARTFDKILDGVLAGTKFVLLEQVVRELIAYNFPRSAWEKDGIGQFTQRELTTEERQKEMEVAERAVNLGVVDTNDLADLNEIRMKAGFSEREEPIPKETIDPLTGEVVPEEGLPDDGLNGGPAEEEEDVEVQVKERTKAPARKPKAATAKKLKRRKK